MNDNWKPGDVAIVTAQPFAGMKRTERAWVGPGECWHFDDGAAIHVSRADMIESARRLVVIDPEDREQIERLDDLLWATNTAGEARDDLQAALREFANPTPPKPEEPTGLGAVVEDAQRFTYTRFSGSEAHHEGDWINEDGAHFQYADIPAVRVLSEGYDGGES